MRPRVVITGLGVVSPIGIGAAAFWESLRAGRVGTGRIAAFSDMGFDSDLGGEVAEFDPSGFIERLDPSQVARTTQFAIAVARMAVDDAGVGDLGRQRTGICFGTTMGNQSVVERANDARLSQAASGEPLSAYPATRIASEIARELGTRGPALVVPTACAAGNYAIGWGYDLIQSGRADCVLAGGSDALSRGCYAVFNRLRALARDVCRPFDRTRSGMMVSEGGAALLLERADRAEARGARAYAELLGYGLSCDAFHPTAPHPEGDGAVAAMLKALEHSGRSSSQVSYISAHGTGTRANDSTESRAVSRVLGPRVEDVPVSSIKSMIGHTMGAASAIEAVASVLAIHHGVVPPTANFQEPDPECLQNVVPNQPQVLDSEMVLSNAFGFGGNIATIALGRP